VVQLAAVIQAAETVARVLCPTVMVEVALVVGVALAAIQAMVVQQCSGETEIVALAAVVALAMLLIVVVGLVLQVREQMVRAVSHPLAEVALVALTVSVITLVAEPMAAALLENTVQETSMVALALFVLSGAMVEPSLAPTQQTLFNIIRKEYTQCTN
tara:strand:- start:483 stop:956 length:474 start_codon:yes stop_codon:yes gene_type:complete